MEEKDGVERLEHGVGEEVGDEGRRGDVALDGGGVLWIGDILRDGRVGEVGEQHAVLGGVEQAGCD